MKNRSPILAVILALIILLPFLFNCKKESVRTIPTIKIAAVTDITATTAKCGGEITSDGGTEVTARGVCWSTNQNPTTADNKTPIGTGSGSFATSISGISGLTPATTYYIRAYATNSIGTAYSSQSTFSTMAQYALQDPLRTQRHD